MWQFYSSDAQCRTIGLRGLPARGAALNSYDKREIRGIEPGGAHHRTTEYHEPEPEWGESPHHPRRKLTRQA